MPDAQVVKVLRAGGAGSGSATDLDILDLPSLIQALAANRRTGTLKIAGDAGEEACLYFREGVPVLASPPAADSSLLEDALLKARVVAREELESLREAARAAGCSAAEHILHEMEHCRERPAGGGIITPERFDPDRLRVLLINQVTERAADLLSWKKVHCEFFPGRLLAEHLDPALAHFSPGVIADGLLLEAARRQDEWERIRQVFDPSSDVFEMLPDRPRVEARESWAELAALLDGYRDVSELVAASTLGALEVCRGLLDMVENGLVRVRNAPELAKLGDLAAARSDWPKARRLFRRALQLDDSRHDLRVKLAAACEALGDLAGARSGLMAFVTRCVELGDHREAARACRHLVEIDPDNPEPRLWLFRALLEIGDHKGLRSCGKDLAGIYERESSLERAGEVLAKLREIFPEDAEISEMAARVRLAAAQRTEALVEYERLAESYVASGDFENAVRVFRKIVEEIDEECLEARIHLAECLIKLGRTNEAAEEYKRLAEILSRTGVIDQAASLPFMLRVSRRIAELDPDNTGSRQWLAETYAARRDRKNSLEQFDELLAIHQRADDRRALIAALRRVGELFPDEAGYLERLADCYLAERGLQHKAREKLSDLCAMAYERQDYAMGSRVAAKLLQLDPLNLSAHALLGEALLSRGDHAAAADKLLAVARACLMSAQDEQAEEALRAVLQINEAAAEAHRLLARLLESRGETAEAAGHYRQAGILEYAEDNFGLARADLERAARANPDDAAAAKLLRQMQSSRRPPPGGA